MSRTRRILPEIRFDKHYGELSPTEAHDLAERYLPQIRSAAPTEVLSRLEAVLSDQSADPSARERTVNAGLRYLQGSILDYHNPDPRKGAPELLFVLGDPGPYESIAHIVPGLLNLSNSASFWCEGRANVSLRLDQPGALREAELGAAPLMRVFLEERLFAQRPKLKTLVINLATGAGNDDTILQHLSELAAANAAREAWGIGRVVITCPSWAGPGPKFEARLKHCVASGPSQLHWLNWIDAITCVDAIGRSSILAALEDAGVRDSTLPERVLVTGDATLDAIEIGDQEQKRSEARQEMGLGAHTICGLFLGTASQDFEGLAEHETIVRESLQQTFEAMRRIAHSDTGNRYCLMVRAHPRDSTRTELFAFCDELRREIGLQGLQNYSIKVAGAPEFSDVTAHQAAAACDFHFGYCSMVQTVAYFMGRNGVLVGGSPRIRTALERYVKPRVFADGAVSGLTLGGSVEELTRFVLTESWRAKIGLQLESRLPTHHGRSSELITRAIVPLRS